MLHEQQRLCGTELDMRKLTLCKITQVLNWSKLNYFGIHLD